MKYIDIHCHLGFPDYDADREGIILQMQQEGGGAITVGVDFETSLKELEIARKYENIFACIGQHPDNLGGFDQRLVELAYDDKVVAIGECGLDYFRLEGDVEKIKKEQKEIFEKHIVLALEAGKPLMLHIRPSDKISFDAYFDSLEILEKFYKDSGGNLCGNAHFFVGNTDVLKRFLDIGFSVSFAGVITFANEYDECVKYVPRDSIMSETDAPFVAPVPYRGKRNEPLFVKEVVKKMAEIRGEDENMLNAAILDNFKRVFRVESD